MHRSQSFNKKRKCVTGRDRCRECAQKSIFVKDLPINDLRFNLDYPSELHEPVKCKGAPVNGFKSKADILGKVIFKLFMSYSEASQLSHMSHPLQNIILKPENYLEGPKPGILKKMNSYSLPPNDYSIYEVCIPEVKTLDDIKTVNLINWLWVNQRHNYDAWMKIISAMVQAQWPMRVDSIEKCVSTRVLVNAFIGRRGLCHGLCDIKVPKIEINQSSQLDRRLPRWALDFSSDDNSSFHSSSPDNSDFDTDSADSGPIGVARNRPRITGFTSFTETSDESSRETWCKFSIKPKTSRLDFFTDGRSGDYWDRRMRKRFDLYIQTSLNERRNRGAIRETRRKVRILYDKQRRTMEPAYDAEAKRAEALAAERVRAEIRNREAKQRVNNNPRQKKNPVENYLCRYKQFNHELRSQLECSWTRYYGEKCIPSYFNNSEHRKDISLKCFVSPVPYIEQKGINNGFAVVCMALRQMRLIEVILGEEGGKHYYEAKEFIEQFPNGARYLLQEKSTIIGARVRTSSEWNNLSVLRLISEVKRHGITNWGEIFSAIHLNYVANYANEKDPRYNSRLVDRDLLANYKNDLSSGDSASTRYNSMSIVQRLVRGHLIAVCYDADEKKRPTNNGGRSAYWTLLCGVIVGFPSKQPPKKPLPVKESKVPHKDKELAYVYHFEPDIHMLTPQGFFSRETDKPVNIKTINERAALVDEEPNDNGENHSQNCNEGRHKCQRCTIEYVDKELDLERDADSVWVVARHRDEYVVWTLRELANSNRQLCIPNKEILDVIPRHVKNEWLVFDGLISWRKLSASLKTTSTTHSQRNREQLDAKRRENRALCSMMVDQMDWLSRKYPSLHPFELVQCLDMSMFPQNSVEVWKSAAKVAYETRVKFPRNKSVAKKMSMMEELRNLMPEAPPPFPIPTSPTPVAPPMNTGSPNVNCPYVIQCGPNLNLTLAQQYVCFEPLEGRYKNNGMDDVPDVYRLNNTMLMPVDFFFSIDGKLASKIRKEKRFRMAAAKNRASTSRTFTG